MSNFERILVPVDFSDHSAEATRIAADLALRFGASLALLHVYDPLAYALPDGFIPMPQAQTDKLLEMLHSQLASSQRVAVEAGVAQVDTKLLHGFVAGQIVDFASQGKFDLIVMGTHGRTGIRHLVMGSIAERVVRLASCPVLTVKPTDQRQAA